MDFHAAVKFGCFFLLLWLRLVFAEIPMSASQPITKPGCQEKCGGVSIPYPFGIGKGCYLQDDGDWFAVTCYQDRFLQYGGGFNVSDISILDGYLMARSYISTTCDDHDYESPELEKFSFSTTKNKFIAVGCNIIATIEDYSSYVAKCKTTCNKSEDASAHGSCAAGIGCCQASISTALKSYFVEVSAREELHPNISSREELRPNISSPEDLSPTSTCAFGFLAEADSFNFSSSYMKDFRSSGTGLVPVVIDWSIGYETCDVVINSSLHICGPDTDCIPSNNGEGYRCRCKKGYEGNPYLNSSESGGCQDIDECLESKPCKNRRCINTNGSYECVCPTGKKCPSEKQRFLIFVVVPSGVGVSIAVILLAAMSYWLYIRFEKRKQMKLKEKHFTRNGGLLLNQKISSNEGGVERAAKVFTAEELEKTTDNFNPSRIIGKGGFGTVFKGMLSNGEIVAIKKSTLVDEAQVDQFINEVAILSQINHRHIVRLLGCCLETQVPLLVYEFVPNGTLSDHLHVREGDLESLISWKDRVRIAYEVAGALAYLHSDAYMPIFHRDIKSTNILLDEKYKAKVSDFGISRSTPIDATHLTTLVQGTFGYLDPEYFHSSQLTEKSDVYSFGIVLVELLTGEKAISKIRQEEEKSLALYFIKSLKENRLSEILDARVLNEGNTDDVLIVGKLAKKCLKYVGKKRPTMKEVSQSLGGLYEKLMKDSA